MPLAWFLLLVPNIGRRGPQLNLIHLSGLCVSQSLRNKGGAEVELALI